MKNRSRAVQKPQTSSKGSSAKSAVTLRQEIAERERGESELRRLSRALLTISQCNHAVVRAQTEQELLESICRNMVDAGGYRMAWVGYAEQDAARQVCPVAHAGFEEGYLSLAQITWGEGEHGRGPTGRAIRTGKPEINRLTQTDDTLSPWREEALKRGYLSSIALPLRSGEQTLGALTLYSEEPEAFDQNEVKLLSDLAEDLSFGIDTIRTRAERGRAEEELRLTQFSLEHASDPVFWMDSQGRTVYVNEAACRSLGRTREELLSLSILDIDPSLSAESWKAVWEKLKAQNSITLETCHRTKDGRTLPVEVTGNYLQFRGKEYAFAFARDITERKRADEALRNNEAKFRAIIENSRDGILFADAENKIVYRSPSYQLINGFTDEERLGRPGYETVHPDDVEALRRAWELIVEHPGKTYEIADYRIRHKDGTWKWVESSAANLLANPHVGAIVVTTRDLTERRRAEEALRESEASFRTLAEAVPQLVWMCTPNGLNIYFNQRWVDYTGLTLEESYGKGWNTPFHPDDKQAAWDAWSNATETGERYQVESRLRATDGSYRWFLMRGEPLLDTTGRVAKWFGTCTDIDELKQAAEALQREKAFTEAVIDSFPDVFFVIQETGKFLHWGRNPKKVLGYSSEETLAMESALEIVAEEDRPLAALAIAEAFSQGNTAVEVHLLHREGRKSPYLVRATRAIIGQGTYVVGLGLDITERKRAEEALRQSEAALKEALLAAQMGVWNRTLATDSVTWDENLYRILGREKHLPPPSYQELAQIYTPASWERLKSAVEHTIFSGTPYDLDLEMLRSDGSKRWVISRGEAVRDASGRITQLRGTVQDITERMRADQRVRESEEKFRKAFMTGADSFHIARLDDGEIIEVNDSSEQVFGYTREEMIGKTALELGLYTNPLDRQRMVSEVKARGYVKNMEVQGRKKNGELIYALLSVSQIHGDSEQLIVGVARDITEKKRAEAELREREARLKEAEKLAHLGSSTWDIATDTTTWSDELYRIVGRDPHLPPPKHAERAAIYTPESWERLEIAVRQALATGAPYDLELDVVRQDGTKRHVHARGVSERAPDGSIVRLQGTLQDVTEHHRLEQQFRQAQKMEAVGRLAGGVAHDFNNLLTVINGYSEMALEALGPDDPKRTHFSEIRKAGECAADLTRQLLAFSRQQVLAPRVLDLNAVIANIEKMLHRLIGEDIHLAVVQGPALGQVKADPGQIEQIIMNLVVNARDAMPHGGKVAITTTNAELDKNDIEKNPSVVRGHYVMLVVSDTGIGMDAQTQAHIFEPFFTTKEPGKGTGLGLATVYGIVKQSGGYIWVYSVPGQGTTFKIYLPRVDEPDAPFLPTRADARSLGGSETILLVEDETELSALAVRILEARGYEVLESASPEDALQISARHRGPIHLLLTDVVMPGMSGRKVAEHLTPLRPNMKVLYMSGYTDDSVFRSGVLEPGAAFIQKPFTPSSLARKVRELLNNQRPA